jgi:hypothetical protein
MGASSVLSLLALFLASCLVCQAQDQTSLSGNWHLTGSWNPTANHDLSSRILLGSGCKT